MTADAGGTDPPSAGDSQESHPADDDSGDDQSTPDVDVTPQPAELKRQQLVVGVIVAVLTALAITISIGQNFSGVPTPISISSGVVGGGVVYWIVQHSLFPTESEISTE